MLEVSLIHLHSVWGRGVCVWWGEEVRREAPMLCFNIKALSSCPFTRKGLEE